MNHVRSAAVRTVLFALLWWVLVEGNLSYGLYALVAVPAAVALSLVLAPPRSTPGKWRPQRAVAGVRLVFWVLHRALLGGTDVALRAISRSPGGRTDPQVVTVPMRLTGTARAFALGTFNLMPGTLVQGTQNDDAVVHVLDPEFQAERSWAELEQRVAAVTGQALV
ncbi:Na+/H+ antiporter subunit E [Kocuria sp.]|uniref:Na+/H+ antiporter subunit E n=1 Tax=Kocuria sp. TaxID=1871328 RepID=UPI0026E02537|nr:Na+/H+ antiporter subunit E [Kocuria sp.]MDO5619612.1 Na+/H+ antiporter subunit E [Kocuria sp.]